MQNAMKLHQAGRLDEAERAYRTVLEQEPGHAGALHLLGVIHLQRGEPHAALGLIAKAAARAPHDVGILNNLAAAHARCGQFAEALAVFDRILARAPHDADALIGRSAMLLNLGRPEEALAASGRAIAADPSAARLFHHATILATMKRFAEVVDVLDRLLAVTPAPPEVFNNRGNALAMLGRYGEAIADYDRALAINPDYLEARNNRANALNKAGRFDEALAEYRNVLARQPDRADVLSNCGAVLIELGRPRDALEYLDRSLALQPGDLIAINNRSSALLHLGRPQEALANARASLDAYPDNFEAYYFLLAHGEFAQGWRLYERRTIEGQTRKRGYVQPEWSGEPVSGTLLVSGEQGLGDQILFSGLIPELQGKADHLVVEVEPRLVELFKRSFPRAGIVALRDDLYAGEIAAQTLIGSTARFLRPDLNSFKHHPLGFLQADEKRTAAFRARLRGALNIGISWHSSKAANARAKSAQLIDFSGLLSVQGVRLVDLQYGDTRVERDSFRSSTGGMVTHFDDLDLTNDIDGLAALISACDLVVSVSNTTAHLAGALATPTWVMPPFGHARMWYWVDDGSGNPWYRSVRVRPQRSDETWKNVIDRIGTEIASFAASHATKD